MKDTARVESLPQKFSAGHSFWFWDDNIPQWGWPPKDNSFRVTDARPHWVIWGISWKTAFESANSSLSHLLCFYVSSFSLIPNDIVGGQKRKAVGTRTLSRWGACLQTCQVSTISQTLPGLLAPAWDSTAITRNERLSWEVGVCPGTWDTRGVRSMCRYKGHRGSLIQSTPVKQTCLESWACHSLVMWLWTDFFTCLDMNYLYLKCEWQTLKSYCEE